MLPKFTFKKSAFSNFPPSVRAFAAQLQSDSQPAKKAALTLKTGQVFCGKSFGAPVSVSGEAVFTTSLVGYPESMTDPSYRGQILVFTQPLIGNYGVPAPVCDKWGLLKNFESSRIHVKGIVVNEYTAKYSHWKAIQSLGEWCTKNSVPAVTGVDTRAIVHLLRNQGSTLGRVDVDGGSGIRALEFEDPNERNLVAEVSAKHPMQFNPGGDVHIALIDCGAKHNIIRCLMEQGASVTLVPWDFNFNEVIDQFDGIFISNGPGSPSKCRATINNLKVAFSTTSKPIFGICMGNLLMGMAAGLKMYKLPFGNRGHNQPVINVDTGACVVTSQNHGYALDDGDMPLGWRKYFVNANDGTNEGIRHEALPFSSVQFHPEAKGGPCDTYYMFADFVAQVRADKRKRVSHTVFMPEVCGAQQLKITATAQS